MAIESKIEWTDATWNVVVGCFMCSPGCLHCYAIKDAWRMAHNPNLKLSSIYSGLVEKSENGKLNWTGKVKILPERILLPSTWKTPKNIFVNSQSDLFHEDVPFWFIDDVFNQMKMANWHTYIVLTKRPERLLLYAHSDYGRKVDILGNIKNLRLGVSTENQKQADIRIDQLLEFAGLVENPDIVYFLSCEPLLESLNIKRCFGHSVFCLEHPRSAGSSENWATRSDCPCPKIQWVITGGESGHGARPMNEDWIRSLRDQCQEAGVKFFYKQKLENKKKISLPLLDGKQWAEMPMEVAR